MGCTDSEDELRGCRFLGRVRLGDDELLPAGRTVLAAQALDECLHLGPRIGKRNLVVEPVVAVSFEPDEQPDVDEAPDVGGTRQERVVIDAGPPVLGLHRPQTAAEALCRRITGESHCPEKEKHQVEKHRPH